ncbi:MAG: flagellin lysine-N-methylase [Ruminococcus sp.]|nr:flagellin lysine-N-methylase [Ruminococcus sp.]
MLISYPEYYKKFKCIADRCSDTCCAKWTIVVDEDSAERFRRIGGDFGERLSAAMTVDEDGDTVFINKNNRCPFLNSGNLCDIYINLGENSLCKTCERFPRFRTDFGGTAEVGLSLSCPVAAGLIVESPGFPLESDFDDSDPDINDLDADLYFCLKTARKTVVNFIADGPLTMGKLSALLVFAEDLQGEIDSERFSVPEIKRTDKPLGFDDSVFEKLSYLTEEGERIFKSLSFIEEFALTDEHKNILLYYIYRYLLKAAYDGNARFALKLSVFATAIIAQLNIPTVESAVLFSKEIEHSADNLSVFAG